MSIPVLLAMVTLPASTLTTCFAAVLCRGGHREDVARIAAYAR